jgi:hypothetical protein
VTRFVSASARRFSSASSMRSSKRLIGTRTNYETMRTGWHPMNGRPQLPGPFTRRACGAGLAADDPSAGQKHAPPAVPPAVWDAIPG